MPILCFWRCRHLIWELLFRDIRSSFRGSILGTTWLFATPLLMLAIYTLVFGGVLRAHWPGQEQSTAHYALTIFIGIIVFNIFAEVLQRSPNLMRENVNLIKKVRFPIDSLVWSLVLMAMVRAGFALVIFIIGRAAIAGPPPQTIVMLPLVLVPLVLFTVGIAWMVASLGVFFRDTAQITGIATSALMLLCPIFYPSASIPPAFHWLLSANPIATMVEMSRNLALWGTIPGWQDWLEITAVGCGMAWLGHFWFSRTSPSFSDVL
jgi:lipopolysaccharide transport system permease protein